MKKLIQKNEEVGKLDHSIPFLMCSLQSAAKSLEYFLKGMLNELIAKHKDQKVKLNPTHLKALIVENPKYAFLQEIVQPIPDSDKPEAKKKGQAVDKAAAKQLKKRAPEKKALVGDDSDDESDEHD